MYKHRDWHTSKLVMQHPIICKSLTKIAIMLITKDTKVYLGGKCDATVKLLSEGGKSNKKKHEDGLINSLRQGDDHCLYSVEKSGTQIES